MSLFKRFRKRDGKVRIPVHLPSQVSPCEEGILVPSSSSELVEDCVSALCQDLLARRESDGCLIPWRNVYRFHSEEEYEGIPELLGIPELDPDWRPVLRAVDGFTDPTFRICIDGWMHREFSGVKANSVVGLMVQSDLGSHLVSEPCADLLDGVRNINAATTSDDRRLMWGRIRNLALEVGASLDGFLKNTIFLTPEHLRFKVHESATGELLLEPVFPNVPDGWIRQFDTRIDPPGRIDFSDDAGAQVSLLLSDEVRDVLSSIKKQFPSRRLVGEKGRRFLRNPFSMLPSSAKAVLDDAEVERATGQWLPYGLGWNEIKVQERIQSVKVHLLATSLEQTIEPIRILNRSDFRVLSDRYQHARICGNQEFPFFDRWIELGQDPELTENGMRELLSRWDAQVDSMIEIREADKTKNDRFLQTDDTWISDEDADGECEISMGGERKEGSVRLGFSQDSSDAIGASAIWKKLGEWSLPASLRQGIRLRSHQLDGVRWLWDRYPVGGAGSSGVLFADDMGLGKTIQGLSFLASLFERIPDLEPALIVAPVSLLDNWLKEIETFFESGALRVLRLHDDELRRRSIETEIQDPVLFERGIQRCLVANWREGFHVVLTSYEVLRDFEMSLADSKWSVLVLDEAQRIKNPSSFVSRSARALPSRFRIACTGTPVENSLRDLWSLFQFAKPGLLGDLDEFTQSYRRPIEIKTEEERGKLESLRTLIDPWILRRTKADVAPELPPKIVHSGAKIGSDEVLRLSSVQLDLYGKVRGSYAAAKEKMKGASQNQLFKALGELRMVCALSIIKPSGEVLPYEHNPKATWLIEELRRIESAGEKAIVFSEFLDVQLNIRSWIKQEFGIHADLLNGSTPVQGPDGRQARIERFSRMPGFGILILGTKALGAGVNIQAANHVVHYTRSWNPAIEDQATDRAYRIGQTRPVHVYTPTVTHPSGAWKTFEEVLNSLLERKRALATDILNGTCDDNDAIELSNAV